jgi:hypothetical protein
MADPTGSDDHASEVKALLMLAGWYRAWAALTDSEQEKAQRLDMAAAAEERACILASKQAQSC